MTDLQTHVLEWRVKGRTIAENLDRAIAGGLLKRHQDGTFELIEPTSAAVSWALGSSVHLRVNCRAQINFLFRLAYASSAVPSNCRACYKVKVLPRTLRELMAVYEIAKTTPYVYKCGLDEIPSSQCLYSAFFYADELAGARATFAVIRKAIDEHAQLGPDVEMFIKRGCTEYELACGPSDQYTFADELPEIEASLLARFRKTTRRRLTAADGAQTLALWIRTAFKHKDDTYLDFTAGRPIFPPTVRYSPTDGSDRRPSGTTGSPLESEPPSPYQGANPRM